MGDSIKWAAELPHVREVSLLGTADLAFWQARLQPEDLAPAECDGKAQVLIIAADMKFKGIRFHELSFSVLVDQRDNSGPHDAAFLTQAFSSNRLFAVCERTFFSTPYRHGDVLVSAEFPASIRLRLGGETVFQAAMQSDTSRKPARTGDGGWDGPVFLPRCRERLDGRLFFARLRGETRTYLFDGADAVTIRPPPGRGILQALVDSHFAGREWSLRPNAIHAKSKTYPRTVARGG